jgi:hypothetical protein
MFEGSKNIKNQVGYIHLQKYHTPKEVICFKSQNRSWRGQTKGLRFCPTLSVKQSDSLKEVTQVMESGLPDESLSCRDA